MDRLILKTSPSANLPEAPSVTNIDQQSVPASQVIGTLKLVETNSDRVARSTESGSGQVAPRRALSAQFIDGNSNSTNSNEELSDGSSFWLSSAANLALEALPYHQSPSLAVAPDLYESDDTDAVLKKCDAFEARLQSRCEFIPAHKLRPNTVWLNELARYIGVGREKLRSSTVRARINEWSEDYGIHVVRTVQKLGPLSLNEFIKLAAAKRQRELNQAMWSGAKSKEQVGAELSNTRWALKKLKETYSGEAEARVSTNDLLVNAAADAAKGGPKLRQELRRFIAYMDELNANKDLPTEVADLIQHCMDRKGVMDADVVRALGIRREVIWAWRTGKNAPSPYAYAMVNALEEYLNLPRDTILSRARQRQRGLGAVPTYLFPEEFQGKKNNSRFLVLKHLTPEDFVADDEQRHANIRKCLENIRSNPSEYGCNVAKLSKQPYRWKEADWCSETKYEWETFLAFQNDALVPFGMNRKQRKAGWKPDTSKMFYDYFCSLFGTWSATNNPVFKMDTGDVALGYLVFPRLVHLRLQVALGWSKELGAGAYLPNFDIQRLIPLRAMLHSETGWITQSPHLAQRLKPIIGKDGKIIISQAEIDHACADWPRACRQAWEEYGRLKKSHKQSGQRRRDTHKDIMPILKLSNPLVAFQTLCTGLQNDRFELRSYAHAIQLRDQVLAGLLTQCAFRRNTLRLLDLEHLSYDAERNIWALRVPREIFKNQDGPYFVSPNREVRPFYERDLIDQFGLYEALNQYLCWGRTLILAGTDTQALLICGKRRARKPGSVNYEGEQGRFQSSSVQKLTKQLTGRYVGYKPKTGRGLEGIKQFPPHAFRHILATGILKLSKSRQPEQEAADAIHDSIDMVRSNYARYVPRDREKTLMATLQSGFGVQT
ncbi:hypothetical protein V1282_003553 [Nitrobacteraceae bacterium AZCC 2146]